MNEATMDIKMEILRIQNEIKAMEDAHPLHLNDKTSQYEIDTCWVFDGKCYETIIFGRDASGNRTNQTFLVRRYYTEDEAIATHKEIVKAWS